jgi:hypothetical protein
LRLGDFAPRGLFESRDIAVIARDRNLKTRTGEGTAGSDLHHCFRHRAASNVPGKVNYGRAKSDHANQS